MKNKSLTKQKIILASLVIPTVSIFIYFLITIYFLLFKATSESYSVTQTWKEYHGLEDWNLTTHALTDIDGDGQKDIITFTNCAFLSSVLPENIPTDKQCQEPGMSSIAFPDDATTIGQELTPSKPFLYEWVRKSYLVKTKNNVWKFYDMNGLQIKTYELGKNNLFTEIKPTFFDIIDTFVYQISHIGVVFTTSILSSIALLLIKL